MKKLLFFLFLNIGFLVTFLSFPSFSLAQAGGSASGKVITEGGVGISKATILATLTGRPDLNQTATSDSQGNFTVNNLYAGSYTLVISARGYQPNSVVVEISQAFPTANIGNFTLHPEGTIPPPTGDTPTPDQPEAPEPVTVSGEGSRPYACNACNVTSLLTGSCATTFTVNDHISYKKSEGDLCTDGLYYVKKEWGGTVTIDPTSTTIPFVGKEGAENERKYLADYFEGTDKYYAFYTDPLEIETHSGVWRKLAPMSVQDEYKKELIGRRLSCGDENGTHDYNVTTANGDNATLTEIANHFPPTQGANNYLEDYDTWKNSGNPPGQWYRLWQSVPMFSREDTPGSIVPIAAIRYPDLFTQSSGSLIEKVPHVARLYDETKAINTLLSPAGSPAHPLSGSTSQSNQDTLLASAETQSPSGKTLLAQAFTASMDITPEITPSGGGNYSVCWVFQAMASCGVYDLSGPLTVLLNGGLVYGHNWGPVGYSFPYHCSYLPFGGPVNVAAAPGDTITVCAEATNANHHCPADPRPYLKACVSCLINADGSTTCGSGTPPAQVCGLPNAPGAASCDKEAIRDSNPNDNLCCTTINYSLRATDTTVNRDAPCTATSIIPPSCPRGWADTDGDGKDDWQCPASDPCIDNGQGQMVCTAQPPNRCDATVSVGVSRQVAVGLAHPYLSEIWNYTAEQSTGFLNIFRPDPVEKFRDLDAASNIYYSYSPGSVSPSTGSFYYPYLGGIQLAKEWTTRALYPNGMAEASPISSPITPETPPPDRPTGSLQNMLEAAEQASHVASEIIGAILAIESPIHYNNPSSTYCPVSSCGATGPMQITTGWKNVNCDESKGAICEGYCVGGTVPPDQRSAFDTWGAYASPGMDACNLADALVVGGRILSGKVGNQPITLNDCALIAQASKNYYGEGYDSSLSCAANCHSGTKFSRLGNRTYCEYVFWHAGIENLIN